MMYRYWINVFFFSFLIQVFAQGSNQDGVNAILNQAQKLYDAKSFVEAAQAFEQAYLISKKQNNKEDLTLLYSAAIAYHHAQQLDKALPFYKQLIDQNYTGERTVYSAIDVKTGKTVGLDKVTYDLFKKTNHKDFKDLKESLMPNVNADLYEYATAILIEKGEIKPAFDLVLKGLSKYPKRKVLLSRKGLLQYRLGDLKGFEKTLEEAIENDPNDAMNYYNLGTLIKADTARGAQAEQLFEKALLLKPDYFEAYLNLAEVYYQKDEPLVQSLKKLETSKANLKTLNVIRQKRKVLYEKILSYLKKAEETKPDDLILLKNLEQVYGILGDNQKQNQIKQRITVLK